jgi:hypothetical protein
MFDAVNLLREYSRTVLLRVWRILALLMAQVAVSFLQGHSAASQVSLCSTCDVLLQIAKDQPSGALERSDIVYL